MYKDLSLAYEGLINNENYEISLLANTSAFIYEHINNLNWVGFYNHIDNKLILGPFQGKVACNVIEPGRGVCGSSLVEKRTIVVDDVANHPNHIYCDFNSKSELVIPIIIDNNVYGVLDLDAPVLKRFDNELVSFLEDVVSLLTKKLNMIKKK